MENNLRNSVQANPNTGFKYRSNMKIKRTHFWVRRYVSFNNNWVKYYKKTTDKEARLELDLTRYYVQIQHNRHEATPLMLISDNKQNYALKIYFNSEKECEDVLRGINPYVKVDRINLNKNDQKKRLIPENKQQLSKNVEKNNLEETQANSHRKYLFLKKLQYPCL